MMNFNSFLEVVNHIRQNAENPEILRWNNAAGDWDLEELEENASQYDEVFSGFCVDDDYSIHVGDAEDDLTRIEDAPNLNYEVYEDDGGGLCMFVLNGKNPIWGHSGYEFSSESLSRDIEALADTVPEDVRGWDGNGMFSGQAFAAWEDTPAGGIQAAYLEISQGAELVADGSGAYPDRMGAVGREAFGI